MNKEQKERIKLHIQSLRSNEQQRDEALEDFVIEEIADRVKLYLNADEIEPRLERIVARIVVASLAQAGEQKANGNIEQEYQRQRSVNLIQRRCEELLRKRNRQRAIRRLCRATGTVQEGERCGG